jgi:hypothetical protein
MEVPYRCPKCGDACKFGSLGALKKHLETEHHYTSPTKGDLAGMGRRSPFLELLNQETRELERELELAREKEKRNREARNLYQSGGGLAFADPISNFIYPSFSTPVMPQNTAVPYPGHMGILNTPMVTGTPVMPQNAVPLSGHIGVSTVPPNTMSNVMPNIIQNASPNPIPSTTPNTMSNLKLQTEADVDFLSKELHESRRQRSDMTGALYGAQESIEDLRRKVDKVMKEQQRVVDALQVG